MEIQAFEIGGCVRDEIMGFKPKDIDYTVVAPSYEAMKQFVIDGGMKIVVESPEFQTIRAVAREPFMGHTGGLDFVWARQEGPYSDGRRPDWVRPGTLLMDQQRRDFTCNAIAKDTDGSYIDPFNGRKDIADRIIRAVGDPVERLTEDALRAVRAIRFRVTKRMVMDGDLCVAIQSPEVLEKIASKAVSDERIRVEVEKMLAFSTLDSFEAFQTFPLLTEAMFSGSVGLTATMKTKGRGK